VKRLTGQGWFRGEQSKEDFVNNIVSKTGGMITAPMAEAIYAAFKEYPGGADEFLNNFLNTNGVPSTPQEVAYKIAELYTALIGSSTTANQGGKEAGMTLNM